MRLVILIKPLKVSSENYQSVKKQHSGFTLLEVMVALFIVAIAMGGAIKVMGNAANNTSRLTSKTFAQWVALNQMADLKIKKAWPKFGKIKGKQEMAGQKWVWRQETIKTADKNVKRIELSVWNDRETEADPFVTVVGFLAKP